MEASGMTRICKGCGYAREIGVEIGARGQATCNECSKRFARAGSRFRYYTQRGIAADERLCPRCGYPFKRQPRKRSKFCDECRVERRDAYERWYKATHKEQSRVYEARFRERIYSDPYLLEQHRKGNRERAAIYRAKDPAHFREIEKRTYDKRRADPKRWRKWLDEQSERTRARRLANGDPVRILTPKVYNQRSGDSIRQRLPVEPLIFNMREYLGGDEQAMANLAFVSGIPIRRVQGILNGEFANVTVTTADRLCAGLQVPLSLVYPDAA
jgi:hypothetical protein